MVDLQQAIKWAEECKRISCWGDDKFCVLFHGDLLLYTNSEFEGVYALNVNDIKSTEWRVVKRK